MKIIDTHFHPDTLIEFENKKNNAFYSNENIISECKKNMVETMFCISTEEENFNAYINLSNQYKEYYFSIGFHPNQAKIINLNDSLLKLKKHIIYCKEKKLKLIGIGETGIDLYREEDIIKLKEQVILFQYHIELSIEHNIPLVIHTRNATSETYNILKNYKNKINGTIHAFCDDYNWAKKFIDIGFKLGIGGVISYPKNEHIRDAIKNIGIKNILLETDAPFLPMQFMRGKINHPMHCYNIGIFISNLLQINHEICFEVIYKNTLELFKI
jgi:TatD DNase family protein